MYKIVIFVEYFNKTLLNCVTIKYIDERIFLLIVHSFMNKLNYYKFFLYIINNNKNLTRCENILEIETKFDFLKCIITQLFIFIFNYLRNNFEQFIYQKIKDCFYSKRLGRKLKLGKL